MARTRLDRARQARGRLDARRAVLTRLGDAGRWTARLGDPDAAGRLAFAAVERLVGLLDELGGGVCPLIRGDPARDPQRCLVERQVHEQGLHERLCLLGLDALEQQRELVAADPEGLAAGPQPLADSLQRPVALRVAERVVEPLEAVEVEQADAQTPAAAQLGLEPLLEAATVAEAGDRVRRRRAHRLECAQHRALVEVVGRQRRDQQQR